MKKRLKQLEANGTTSSTVLSTISEAAKPPNSNDEAYSNNNNLSDQSMKFSFPHDQPPESSKLEGSNNIHVPPHDDQVPISTPDFSSSATTICGTVKTQNDTNQTIINASEAFEEVIHSSGTQPIGNGGLNTPEDAQETFIDQLNSGQLIIGPSCNTYEAMWQQEPIWPYDFYELENVCNDWVNYVDAMM